MMNNVIIFLVESMGTYDTFEVPDRCLTLDEIKDAFWADVLDKSGATKEESQSDIKIIAIIEDANDISITGVDFIL